ncbi:MAG: SdiA-regulated domain-containing protein [Pontiellaceae bacterium]|nr:SdiA-regulated domain-containing protein [Pontiellaceae bacterium]
MSVKLYISLFTFTITCGCTPPAPANQPFAYNLSSPTTLYTLPEPLNEISALVYLNPSTLLCVQDEHGVLFSYNPQARKIMQQIPFGENGDYEGLAAVGKTIYVLRSDGVLFEIKNYSTLPLTTTLYPTDIPAKDNEGLCHDAKKNRLLIASKSRSGKGDDTKDKRFIYAFDLNTKKLSKDPAFILDLKTLAQFAGEAGILDKKKNQTPPTVLQLKPSAIAIHPVTGNLYLLSGPNQLLLVFDNAGTLLHIEQLDSDTFNQAEGISFEQDGTLYISNEGTSDKAATIQQFDMQETASPLN